MPPVETRSEQPLHWRSLEELSDRPEFREMLRRGYPDDTWESLPPATRRQFLKVMGASLALAGLASCRWPEEKLVPFARPGGTIPGAATSFATAMEIGGNGCGLLVTSYDGRPIKIEGNPNHPSSLGATDAIAQALVLELYDPDRSRSVARRTGGRRSVSGWEEAAAFLRERMESIRAERGEGLRILSEATSSPSLARLRSRLQSELPKARWHEHEPISRDAEREGSSLLFGSPLLVRHDLERARTIAALDADLLGDHPAALAHARAFAEGRRVESGRMSRLYAIEPVFSLTGGMADHRLALPPSEIPLFLVRLAVELARQGLAIPGANLAELESVAPGVAPPLARSLARDLLLHRGESILAAGPRLPAEAHAAARLIEIALANSGRTLLHARPHDPDRPPHADAIATLVEEMRSGAVRTLILLGGNPVYDAPADLDFAGALAGVEETIRLGLYEDETSAACRWHLPRAHTLESWGDTRAHDGTVSVIQPLIEPLYGGRTPIEILSLLLDPIPQTGHEIVRATLSGPGEPEERWKRSLRDGIVAGTRFETVEPEPRAEGARRAWALLCDRVRHPHPRDGALELVLSRDSKVHDGRFANNSWLQELPDPMTKLTWDNAACVSPATAESFRLAADDVVSVQTVAGRIEIPIYLLPGLPEGTVQIALGYGRKAAGRVGDGVGANAYLLRASGRDGRTARARIERTGRRHKLATTQNHHAIDLVGMRAMQKRVGELIRTGTIEEYRHDPAFARKRVHHPEPVDLWKAHEYEGRQWGMAIDLNACTGCGACVVACQAENNVPVVGKKEVLRSREMHWLRIDRYFSGDPDDPRVSHQPMACVQCENAPCEQVCPVNATLHTSEGLNAQVYNRCVGTRYCSNNCPYKARRFNWFNNQKDRTEIEKMVHNPEVTVRARGVMEKCTFCIQRIEGVKIRAKNEGREIVDGEIVPACAQACPTQAIVFGNLGDPSSRVAALHASPRVYGILEELNTRPRTRFGARILNPDPELAPEADRPGGHYGHHGEGHGEG